MRDFWSHALAECCHGIEVNQPDLLDETFNNSTPLKITFEPEDGTSGIHAF